MNILLLVIIILLIKCYDFEDRVYVRKSSKDLTYDEWQALRRGIHAMKTRHIRNPLGYYFQSNIHGWDEYDSSETANFIANYFGWHQCTHSHYFFLIWHRMYLYFFERILREASGDPNFALPYWDFSDPKNREIPQPFRIPANESLNPLYERHRCNHMNEGNPLPLEIADVMPALSTTFFAANKTNELNICHSFGGGRVDRPVFSSDRDGLLERLPHNSIHIYLGGPEGFMSDLCTAARDPLFWVNHCMVDRIWESWLAKGGKNLVEEPYLSQTFRFYDETGQVGHYSVKDFLNISKLNYKYDSLLKINKKVEKTFIRSPQIYVSVDETKDLIINNTKRSITLKIKPKFQSLFEDISKGKIKEKNIRFTLQTVIAGSHSRLLFQVYLNLPENTIAYEDKPNFLGTIARFEAHCIPHNKRKELGINNCFDVTDNLFDVLKTHYNYNGFVANNLTLTIVPKSCNSVYYPESEPYLIKFQRTLLVHYFMDNSEGP